MEVHKPLMIRGRARWDLDLTTTENGQYLAVLDFLPAANFSDVQPLPLVVCEAFGSVLAICSRTLTVTETRLLRELPQPASVGFLPALSVGFSDGAAEALASTFKGLRFLCLAAALVTSVGPFDGAKAIITMMHDSKLHENQTTWIPRTQQLADILKSLEAKSAFCGFAELMVQWEIHLRQEVFPRAFEPMAETGDASAQERLDRARRLMLKGLPPPETIARIVDAFRTVAGVKYLSIAEVEIKVGAGAAWVLAFAEWCFGTAPALYLLHARVDGGHTYEHISGPPASLVKVTIPASSSNKFTEILVRYRSKLVSYNSPPAVKSDCYGMVGIESYGQWLLHEIPQKFTIRQDAKLVIRDYFLVKRRIDDIDQDCQCADCCGRDRNSTSESEPCVMEEFYLNFSTILVDIFALSLFKAPELLLVRPRHDRHNAKQLRDTVCDVLRNGEPREFDDGHLLQWARAMVGHVFDDKDRRLIVTSGRGQVVYPSVYESDRIERVGYLRLSHFYGVLKYDRDVYNVMASPDNEASDVSDDQKRYIYENNQNPEILQPTNLYRNVNVSWEVVTQDYGEIQANFLVHIQDRNFTARRNSSLLITALKDTFFYEDCLHDRQSMLEEADRFITNQPPWHEGVAENDENPRVNIIAVDGSEELRHFALAHANGPVAHISTSSNPLILHGITTKATNKIYAKSID
ncbi:hypothetical protein Trihar35433_4516 [Trichoderma harzianum]|nr:hypothetical protein Trihar35433_4516 [Trichoderma harzianum]